VRVTAAAGALGWAVGLMPSAFHGAFSGLPVGVLAVLGAIGAIALLGSIGAAQATVLRRHVDGTGRWIAANAATWLAGLPVVLVAFAVAPDAPAGARAAFAIAGGLGMGFTVAVVTGGALVRLLRSPRARPPQPLRRRAAIRLNHAHAWLYARTGGRAGGRMGGHPVLLLTTTGRSSGLPRRTPLQYERVGGDQILVAAAGGAHEPPAWWRNLLSDPRATLQIGDRVWQARAVVVAGQERAAVAARVRAQPPARAGPAEGRTGAAADPARRSGGGAPSRCPVA
jgi:deazaflavin-dependent oxidoreductase (nitroreductase family)